MKIYMSLSLKGKDWWGPVLAYWLVVALGQVLGQVYGPGLAASKNLLLSFIVYVLFILVVGATAAIFQILLLRMALPTLSIAGDAFSFKGSIGRFLGIYMGGLALTIVTVGIFTPWFVRRITRYILSETSFRGTSPEFLGKGGKLLKYLLLAVVVPVIVMMGALVGVLAILTPAGMETGLQQVTMIATFAIILLVMLPFYYLFYKWLIDFRWNDITISWKTSFWPSCGYVLGQMALCAITAGIYWPAATLRVYRYFVGKTVLLKNGVEIGRLGFDGSIGGGFGLLWGQTLLAVITAGIYLPWGTAKVGRWLLCATYHEGSAAAVPPLTAQ